MRSLFFVLFCFASLLLFLGVSLPVIYSRGVRYSRCPSLWLLPLSLFYLIAIPLSLLYFIPLSLSLLCLPIWACTIYICIWLPLLPYVYYMWLPWFVFVFVPWFFSPSESLAGKDVPCRLLPRPRFLLSAFFSFLFFSDRVRPQFVLV